MRRTAYGPLFMAFAAVSGIAAFFLAVVMPILSSYLTELWWFEDIGQRAVFVKRFGTAILTGLAAFAVVLAVMLFNAAVLRNQSGRKDVSLGRPSMKGVPVMALAVAFIASASAGLSMGANWMKVQQFMYAVPFGKADPVFGLDASFYVFRLPLFELLYRGAMQVVIVSIILTGAIYLLGSIRTEPYETDTPGPFGTRRRKSFNLKFVSIKAGQRNHLITLVLVAFALRAVGYLLSIYNLVYSPRGVAFGASYADMHGTLPGLKVMMALCLVAAGLIAYALIRKKGLKPVIAAAIIMVAGSFVTGTLIPGLVQQWYVEPNELAAEEKYITYNIEATRTAYNLDRIEERDFISDGDITQADLASNSRTVENIRLWDWEPLLATLSQLQEMRLYYSFNDVDIDRYMVGGKMRQVMLTAREMDVDSLPEQAQTWINRHLKYTHGYGLVISPVNEATSEGLPNYFLKDIPPSGSPDLAIERPEIYFGELTYDYAIVDTVQDEFDYPMGEQNAENRWEGEGGVPVDSFFKKLAFSYRLGTVKLLLSADLTSESRVLYKRQVNERLNSLAPFLWYDRDPYLVIIDGKLKWVADAYTYTDSYPYSQPLEGYSTWGRGPNYMRNSVKAVVDAYTGETVLYMIDGDDPIIRTYASIFPELFTSGDEVPEEIRKHYRYPEDMFMAQARMYAIYHMQDPAVFYNKEDLWSIPLEVYVSSTAEISPYYVNMSLPGESPDDQRFLIMMPFTPSRKNNMVSWMAGLCDDGDYGRAVVYKFSKQRIFYGPMQIESQIDQDSEIAKLFALWSQKGSSVIRGNMLVYPINHSVLYIEPIFLAAERSQMPQLKLVLASDGTRIAMGSSLGEALKQLVGESLDEPMTGLLGAEGATELAQEAERLLTEAQESLRNSDWAGFGAAQEELGKVLKLLVEALANEQ